MKKRTNKLISLLLVSIMVIASILSVVDVFAEDLNSEETYEQVNEEVEDEVETLLNQNETRSPMDVSNIVLSIKAKNTDLMVAEDTKLTVEFDASDKKLVEGDYFEVKISSDELNANFSNATLDLKMKDTNIKIGEVRVLEGKAIVTFNSEVNKYNEVEGYFELVVGNRFKDNHTKGSIIIESGSKREIIQVTQPEAGSNTDTLFYKTGDYNPGGEIIIKDRPDIVRWSININPARKFFNMSNSESFIIKDKLPEDMIWDYEVINDYRDLVNIEGNWINKSRAEEIGIRINITEDGKEAIISIDPNKLNQVLNGQSISVQLFAKVTDFNLNQAGEDIILNNTAILDTDIEGWNEKESSASIKILRSSAGASGKLGRGDVKIVKIAKGSYNGKHKIGIPISGENLPTLGDYEAIEGVTFNLITKESEEVKSYVTDKDGVIFIKDLKSGEYILEEIATPDGIILPDEDNRKIRFTVDNNSEEGFGYIIENEKEEEEVKTIDISVQKVWDVLNKDVPKPDVVFQLLRNGENYGSPVILKDGEISATWEKLDFQDEEGNKYLYDVVEVGAKEDKIKLGDQLFNVEKNHNEDKTEFTITNKEKPNKPEDNSPNKPDSEKPNKPETPKEENRPSIPNKNEPDRPSSSIPDRPGNPDPIKPNKPNKNEPNKPEEPIIEESEKPLEEPKDVIISDSKVNQNKSDKEIEKEEVTEKNKVVKSNNKVVSNKLDPNKAPQTGDVFNIGRSLLVIFASISALFIISKNKKEN